MGKSIIMEPDCFKFSNINYKLEQINLVKILISTIKFKNESINSGIFYSQIFIFKIKLNNFNFSFYYFYFKYTLNKIF